MILRMSFPVGELSMMPILRILTIMPLLLKLSRILNALNETASNAIQFNDNESVA